MTVQTIQTIPTLYNGIKFRSRLEARWALLFDRLGVVYQYEKEGYQLPSAEQIYKAIEYANKYRF